MIDKTYLNITDSDYDIFLEYIKNITTAKETAEFNILYVCDANYLMNKMSRVRFWAIEELAKSKLINLQLTGPGFKNFNTNFSLQTNILNLQYKIDFIIWYKPLNDNYNFDKTNKLPYKTILRYNEMWDVKWTKKEINESQTDIVICHHYNDYLKYTKMYSSNKNIKFIYLPHHANSDIFKPLALEKNIDILISGALDVNHYPFRNRLAQLILNNRTTSLKAYKILHHIRPRQVNNMNFTNINQIEYNNLINRSKLCIVCSSKYNYRLGKYVEIPMAGSVAIGDLPFEDKRSFERNNIVLDPKMNDDKILKIIKRTLENPNNLNKKIESGKTWAANYTTKNYVSDLINVFKSCSSDKIFIISDDISDNHSEFKGQKWICDELKLEFMNTFPNDTTEDPFEAGIIWYLAPWRYKYSPPGLSLNDWYKLLKYKKVVCTQHHVDSNKLEELKPQFNFMNKFSNKVHAICDKTQIDLEKHLKIDKTNIFTKLLWANASNFVNKNKNEMRNKYQFKPDAFLIGSFQKDTEGKSGLPKLSKGPDIFIKIVKDMYETNKNIEVVLTGLRREYLLSELKSLGINYHYYDMVSLEQINELYNCLDLYLVSSRCEGGPRSIIEAGLTKTPIISTDVGIASKLMDKKAIFDANNWQTYKDAKPNNSFLYNNIKKLKTRDYMSEFKKTLFDD